MIIFMALVTADEAYLAARCGTVERRSGRRLALDRRRHQAGRRGGGRAAQPCRTQGVDRLLRRRFRGKSVPEDAGGWLWSRRARSRTVGSPIRAR